MQTAHCRAFATMPRRRMADTTGMPGGAHPEPKGFALLRFPH
ncbi:hypothetical protein [Paraburkholderia sp. J67]|nr:hypothetical protein [Paraburkholderia sp. J67]